MIRQSYKIFRMLLVTLLVIAVGVPTGLYVLLSLPSVQNSVRKDAERQLTELLGTPVAIGRVSIAPFNSVTLSNVSVSDSLGVKALEVERIGAGIDLWRLIGDREIVVTYAELIGLHGRLYRQAPGQPLNIDPIIKRLQPKDKNKPPTRFKLAITTVVIRKSAVDYDVRSAAMPADGQFSASHIAVSDLRADITLPVISNDSNVVDIRRLAFTERSGLVVNSLRGRVMFTPKRLAVKDLCIEMPGSRLPLDDIDITYGSMANLKENWRSMSLAVGLGDNAYVTPATFAPLYGPLSRIDRRIALELKLRGEPEDFDIERLHIAVDDNPLEVSLRGRVSGITDGIASASVTLPDLHVRADAPALLDMMTPFFAPTPALTTVMKGLGMTEIDGEGALNGPKAVFEGEVNAAPGALTLSGAYDRDRRYVDASVSSASLNLRNVLPDQSPWAENLDITVKGTRDNIEATAAIGRFGLMGQSFDMLNADIKKEGNTLNAVLATSGTPGAVDIEATAGLDPAVRSLTLRADIDNLNPAALGAKLPAKYAGYLVSTSIDASLAGRDADDTGGHVTLTDLAVTPAAGAEGRQLRLDHVDISAETDSAGRHIVLDTQGLRATADGHFRFKTLGASVKSMIADINPELFAEDVAEPAGPADDLKAEITLSPDCPLLAFVGLPVEPLTDVTARALLDAASGMMSVDVSAPYLRMKDKLIESTSLSATLDARQRRTSLDAFTMFPAKGGVVALTIASNGLDGRHDSDVSWTNRSGRNHGSFRFSTGFDRNDDGQLTTDIDVNPGEIVFNDTVWNIKPSKIAIAKDLISVSRFEISHAEQLVSINGAVSRDPDQRLQLRLRDIDLNYVFETLNISSNVMFGGYATGTISASNLFSRTPEVYTSDLFVKDLAYNHAVMGDGHIESAFHPDSGAITIDAVISQANGGKSIINGSITPVGEKLDFRFHADRANVAFLKPFMSAFCDNITGQASGDAHLFGTFKLLDMEGDIYGENLKMTLGLTGTTYTATDSVHIRPGRIEFENIELHDASGHTALLSGLLTHKSFHDPVFEFRVTDARNFLCYDVKENMEHPWYGKVYGTGSVTIKGRPGLVDINADMATTAGTDFTFVLSDTESAVDYDFLTFRDATPEDRRPREPEDTVPELVRELRNRVKKMNQDVPSDYQMTFNIDVTPAARMTLVMDPVGGDRIRAVGSGNLRMSYGSANEDLRMYGTYTLQRGTYNFTLQDIIIKDFTIEDGSSISFHGDPYSAQLDIRAYYALNANLSDLDESFLQDRELNRTNVPVHAMLIVDGDMRSPDISFDLEFPTLTSDTYRKVRSIVSTDDMMNRQIIYLLALNRFYTPDYISATRGNELVSVASSTISSQLSSILGKLDDKISIAPSFRSDRGDFSDVEVDVALSSHLLNNRLILNGNLGYRDKSLNNNSFIGDFDIEYLLNRSGALRLKAYNRYNDQNYYLKSALTTQGVGIVYKRDFDDILSFLNPWRRRRAADKAAKAAREGADSVASPDTIVLPASK